MMYGYTYTYVGVVIGSPPTVMVLTVLLPGHAHTEFITNNAII